MWACRQLDYNNLTEVSKGWLYGLLTLQQLHLGHNAISRIRPDAWEFCQKLSELWVHLVFFSPPSPAPSFFLFSPPSCYSHLTFHSHPELPTLFGRPLLHSGAPGCPFSHSSSSRHQSPRPHTQTHTDKTLSLMLGQSVPTLKHCQNITHPFASFLLCCHLSQNIGLRKSHLFFPIGNFSIIYSFLPL